MRAKPTTNFRSLAHLAPLQARWYDARPLQRFSSFMPKDFAGRGRAQSATSSRPKRNNTTKRRASRRASPKASVIFHGPSFSFGAVLGAGVILAALYAPDFLNHQSVDTATTTVNETATVEQPPAVRFEFPKLLKQSAVSVNADTYAVPEAEPSSVPTSFKIQAASFRQQDEADRLRATLLLQDLPAKTLSSRVEGERWYRVVVGPFSRKVEADRAMTRLREQRLSAIWLNNHN